MSIWVSIPNQGSMKYEIYSSIEHGNVIEQQMPAIHVHRIYKYGHDIGFSFLYTLYICCSLCSIA